MTYIQMTADELRDEAVDRVEQHARKAWLDAAYDAVERICRLRGPGGTFTTDAVWAVLEKQATPPPHEPRAMGPVMRRAVHERLVTVTGRFSMSTMGRNHRRPVRIYEVL